MAKRDKSLEDMDSELAALEAELAALDRGEAPPPKATLAAPAASERTGKEKAASKVKLPFGRKAKETTEPAPTAPAPESPPVEAAPSAGKKLFGKLKIPTRALEVPAADEPSPAAPSPAAPPPAAMPPVAMPPVAPGSAAAPGRALVAIAAAPDVRAPSGPLPVPVLNGAAWARAGHVWRRTAPAKPMPVYRRTLDADGSIVEESPADASELGASHRAADEPERTVEAKRFSFKLGRKAKDVEPDAAAAPAADVEAAPKKKLNFSLGKLGRK